MGRWLASSALTVRPSVEAEPRPEPVVEPEPQPEPEPEPQPDREPQPEPEGASAGADVVGEAPSARAVPLVGDLSVPVFICAPAGVFDSSDLRQVVAGLNTHVSPFYRWQSSGLVDVTFTVGSVVTPAVSWDVVWPPGSSLASTYQHWDGGILPPSQCAHPARSQAGTNRYLMYLHNLAREQTNATGRASYGGAATVYIIDSSRGLNVGAYRFIAQHEVDHSVFSVPHIAGVLGSNSFSPPSGLTRASAASNQFDLYELFDLQEFLLEWEGRGLPGARQRHYLEGDRRNVPAGMSQVFTCYDRERLGWPVGASAPPCARIPPTAPTISVESGNDRSLTLHIGAAPFVDNDVPYGYLVELSEWGQRNSNGVRESDFVARYVTSPEGTPLSLEGIEIGRDYQIAVYPYSRYGVSSTDSSSTTYEFTQKFPPVTVEVQDRSLTREQLVASRPGSSPGDVRLADGLRFRLSWTVPQGARIYQLTGFGTYRTTVTASGQRRTVALNQSEPDIILDGAAHGLEFNTTYTISIRACGEFPGVSDGRGSCHDYAEVALTTPSELPSTPHTPPEPPVYDDYDYPFRATYPFPPASPRIEDRSLTLQQLLQPSPGQSAEDVRQEDGLQYKLSWTAPANVFSYEFIGYGPFRFRMVERGHVTAAWGGSRGSRVPELILDGREHQLEFNYTYNIIIRACFEIEDNDDNPHTHMVECHDFAEVSLTTRPSLSR